MQELAGSVFGRCKVTEALTHTWKATSMEHAQLQVRSSVGDGSVAFYSRYNCLQILLGLDLRLDGEHPHNHSTIHNARSKGFEICYQLDRCQLTTLASFPDSLSFLSSCSIPCLINVGYKYPAIQMGYERIWVGRQLSQHF